jgi:lysophospholipase L1-like esterase
MKSSQRRKILFLVVYIGALFLFQEAVLRFFFPLPEIKNFNRYDYMPKWMSLDSPQTKFIKNIRLVTKSEPDQITMIQRLNAYGFRGQNWKIEKSAQQKRILFVGDSFTEGFLVKDDAVISERFKSAAAKQNRSVEVMNLGVIGSDMADYFHLLTDAIPMLEPDVLFLFMYPNDFTQYAEAQAFVTDFTTQHKKPLTPIRYSILKPRIIELSQMLWQKEMLPFRWPIKKVDFYHPISSPANPWNGHEAELDKMVTPPIAAAIKNAAFNPFIVGGPAYIKRILSIPYDMRMLFSFVQKHVHPFNTQLYVVYIPDRSQLTDYYRQFEAAYAPKTFDLTGDAYQTLRYGLGNDCRELNIPFIDLYDLLKNEEGKGNHLYFQFDEHLSAEAHRLIGEAVFDAWERRNP